MPKVRALRMGYDGRALRAPGAEFDWPDGAPVPAWAELADSPAPVVAGPVEETPVARSVMAEPERGWAVAPVVAPVAESEDEDTQV